MNTIELTFIDFDSWDRPIYEDENGKLYVDVDPRKDRKPEICTKNYFDDEPRGTTNANFVFIPKRQVWDAN